MQLTELVLSPYLWTVKIILMLVTTLLILACVYFAILPLREKLLTHANATVVAPSPALPPPSLNEILDWCAQTGIEIGQMHQNEAQTELTLQLRASYAQFLQLLEKIYLLVCVENFKLVMNVDDEKLAIALTIATPQSMSMGALQRDSDSARKDPFHANQDLAQMDLSQIKALGFLADANQVWGIVQTASGELTHVGVGQALAQGVISAITEHGITITISNKNILVNYENN